MPTEKEVSIALEQADLWVRSDAYNKKEFPEWNQPSENIRALKVLAQALRETRAKLADALLLTDRVGGTKWADDCLKAEATLKERDAQIEKMRDDIDSALGYIRLGLNDKGEDILLHILFDDAAKGGKP